MLPQLTCIAKTCVPKPPLAELSMNAISLTRDFDRELAHSPPLENAHGITLENIQKHRVVPPRLTHFANAGNPSGPTETDAWIVLDECPDSDSEGYLVVFDPENRMYGLAVKSDPIPIFIGCYGSLVKTLNAM